MRRSARSWVSKSSFAVPPPPLTDVRPQRNPRGTANNDSLAAASGKLQEELTSHYLPPHPMVSIGFVT